MRLLLKCIFGTVLGLQKCKTNSITWQQGSNMKLWQKKKPHLLFEESWGSKIFIPCRKPRFSNIAKTVPKTCRLLNKLKDMLYRRYFPSHIILVGSRMLRVLSHLGISHLWRWRWSSTWASCQLERFPRDVDAGILRLDGAGCFTLWQAASIHRE